MAAAILFFVLIGVFLLMLMALSERIVTFWRHRFESYRLLLTSPRDPAAWLAFLNTRRYLTPHFLVEHRSVLAKVLGQVVIFMLMLVLVLMVFTVNSPALAHHGLDAYDTSHLITIEGKVIEYRLMDPHSLLVVEGMNPDGTLTVWEIEGGAGSGIIRAGLSREFLDSYPLVRVSAYQSSNGVCAPRCTASGQDFIFDRF